MFLKVKRFHSLEELMKLRMLDFIEHFLTGIPRLFINKKHAEAKYIMIANCNLFI